ncbi:MAG TPA: hypothetical protein P5239_10665, partial [Victivallales bacterium]|nr:hypothetical protein [Victivallales bacterium]
MKKELPSITYLLDEMKIFLDGKTDREIGDFLKKLLKNKIPSINNKEQAEIIENFFSYLKKSDDILAFPAYDSGEFIYTSVTSLMKDAEFCSKPTEEELNCGIFIIGDIFGVFANEKISAENYKLIIDKERAIIKNATQISLPKKILQSKFPFTYLTKEKKQLKKIYSFSMKSFYEKNLLDKGDTLLFKVEDYDKGIFGVEVLKSIDRVNFQLNRKWITELEEALYWIVFEASNHLNYKDQLLLAFAQNKNLLKNPTLGIEEFIKTTNELQLISCADNSKIFALNDIYNQKSNSLPDDIISISKGQTKNLDLIFEDIRLYMDSKLLKSYMYDAIFNSKNLDSVYERILALAGEPFADEAQKIYFEIMMEEIWEEVSDLKLTFDNNINNIRSRLLSINDHIIKFYTNTISGEKTFESLEENLYNELVEYARLI